MRLGRSTLISRLRLLMAGFAQDRIDNDLILLVLLHLAELDAHPFTVGARNVFADIIGLHGNLAVAAVDENREADGSRPADFEDDAERALDGFPGIDNIIDDDDRPVLEA